MHAMDMGRTHPHVRGNTNDALIRCIEECYDCAQSCVVCADSCRHCADACDAAMDGIRH